MQPKKNRKKVIIISGVLLLVLGILAGAYYLFVYNNAENNPIAQTTTSEESAEFSVSDTFRETSAAAAAFESGDIEAGNALLDEQVEATNDAEEKAGYELRRADLLQANLEFDAALAAALRAESLLTDSPNIYFAYEVAAQLYELLENYPKAIEYNQNIIRIIGDGTIDELVLGLDPESYRTQIERLEAEATE